MYRCFAINNLSFQYLFLSYSHNTITFCFFYILFFFKPSLVIKYFLSIYNLTFGCCIKFVSSYDQIGPTFVKYGNFFVSIVSFIKVPYKKYPSAGEIISIKINMDINKFNSSNGTWGSTKIARIMFAYNPMTYSFFLRLLNWCTDAHKSQRGISTVILCSRIFFSIPDVVLLISFERKTIKWCEEVFESQNQHFSMILHLVCVPVGWRWSRPLIRRAHQTAHYRSSMLTWLSGEI